MSREKYILITYPDSQLLLEEPWIEECHLVTDETFVENIGSDAYFVPIRRANYLFAADDTEYRINAKKQFPKKIRLT